MDTLDFRSSTSNFVAAGTEVETVCPTINGRSLIELLVEYELPMCQAEGSPGIAGAYAGIAADHLRQALVSAQLNGEPVEILVCRECGFDGCWDMKVMVVEENARIVWKGFCNEHRAWDYSRLGPFVFSKQMYTDALEKLC